MIGQQDERASILRGILWILLVALAILPMINNFNEILTRVALTTGFHNYIATNVVPALTNMISIILRTLFRVENLPVGDSIYVETGHGLHKVFVSWNCVGWQSLVLFLFSVLTGLAGDWTPKSKLKCIIVGL